MTRTEETHEPATRALVMRVADNDFEHEVIQKLASLEAKMDMLVGSGQPGRISLIENRVNTLERNDVRRSVYDKLVNAVLTTAISVLIALHERWWK
jgi:hypothetical protein